MTGPIYQTLVVDKVQLTDAPVECIPRTHEG